MDIGWGCRDGWEGEVELNWGRGVEVVDMGDGLGAEEDVRVGKLTNSALCWGDFVN